MMHPVATCTYRLRATGRGLSPALVPKVARGRNAIHVLQCKA